MHSQDDFLRPMDDDVLAVSELTQRIRNTLEEGFPQVWVRGEVSNLRRQSSGHVYFSLKDSEAQLSCVLFRADARRQSFELEDGMDIQLFGSISVYPPRGNYQLIGRIVIESGRGKLQVEYERLKRKLADEGLFDPERKHTLAAPPRAIAVVTSPSGAAVRDFIRILKRRHFTGQVVVFPAKVQGNGAAEEIAAMLERAASQPGFDLIVLTRGGGSIEDLWAFNNESLVRAVADCPLPVVSAIGHEIDHVLTDYAADIRAETPSAAAELISSLFLECIERLDNAQAALEFALSSAIEQQRNRVLLLESRLAAIAPGRSLQNLGMRIDDFENRLRSVLNERLYHCRRAIHEAKERLSGNSPVIRIRVGGQQLTGLQKRLAIAAKAGCRSYHTRLHQNQKRLESSSLSSALKRGFAIIKDTKGRPLTDSRSVIDAQTVDAQFHDGIAPLKVRKDGSG